MNSVQLKTFCTVARTLSFTAASEELMLSQPAVSKQIAALEDEIGTKLFLREHNTLSLTPAGMWLYSELPEKLEELRSVFFSTQLMGLGLFRRIKIGVLRDQRPDPQLIDAARAMRSEGWYFTMQQYDFRGLERALQMQDIDAAVSIRWASNAFTGFGCMKTGEEKLCLAVNMDYEPELPGQLTRETLSAFSQHRPTMIPEASSFSKSQHSSVAARVQQFWNGVREEPADCVIPMVQTGIGSALVNESHALSTEPSVKLFPLDFLQPVDKCIFYPESGSRTAVTDFLSRFHEI